MQILHVYIKPLSCNNNANITCSYKNCSYTKLFIITASNITQITQHFHKESTHHSKKNYVKWRWIVTMAFVRNYWWKSETEADLFYTNIMPDVHFVVLSSDIRPDDLADLLGSGQYRVCPLSGQSVLMQQLHDQYCHVLLLNFTTKQQKNHLNNCSTNRCRWLVRLVRKIRAL